MKITINEQLRGLRSQRKTTQEQLAKHLGISVQAVSKWERGESYPDITLLPAIASFYHVTVDDLLGIGEEKKQAKIKEYTEKDRLLRQQKKNVERVALWREAQKEFPNEPTVLHHLSFSLQRKDSILHSEEIIALSKRLLTESTLSGEYFGAIRNLCYAYKYLGNIEEAKRYASMAGRYIGTENQLMIHILEGEEAVAFCRWNIATLVDLIAANVRVMLEKGDFSTEERVALVKFVLDLFTLLYHEGNDRNYANYYEPGQISMWNARLDALRLQLSDQAENSTSWTERN